MNEVEDDCFRRMHSAPVKKGPAAALWRPHEGRSQSTVTVKAQNFGDEQHPEHFCTSVNKWKYVTKNRSKIYSLHFPV